MSPVLTLVAVLTLRLGIGMNALMSNLVFGALFRGRQSMLFGVEPWDISVFLAISVVMLASGLTASLIPARRATRVYPVEALRSE